jgi:hypothetical protein
MDGAPGTLWREESGGLKVYDPTHRVKQRRDGWGTRYFAYGES